MHSNKSSSLPEKKQPASTLTATGAVFHCERYSRAHHSARTNTALAGLPVHASYVYYAAPAESAQSAVRENFSSAYVTVKLPQQLEHFKQHQLQHAASHSVIHASRATCPLWQLCVSVSLCSAAAIYITAACCQRCAPSCSHMRCSCSAPVLSYLYSHYTWKSLLS
jgi:hypothetical protein